MIQQLETIRRGNEVIILASQQAELREKLLNSSEEFESFQGGRGRMEVITLSNGKAIKRHFQHGGLLGSLFGDLFAGSSRSLSEFFLTQKARQRGAPVPKVLASITSRYFSLFYKGDLITEMLPSRTLAETLKVKDIDDFRPLLKLLLDLHQAGVQHVDLNINNILIPDDSTLPWMVIDLDRCKMHKVLSVSYRLQSLLRMERSYHKIFGLKGHLSFIRRYRIWHHYLLQSGLKPKDYKHLIKKEIVKRRWRQVLWPTN